MTATITAIIPVRDGARTLSRAIASVLDQDVPIAELLVVDDGSRDASRAIALGFGPSVKVLVHEAALGPAAARNTGITAARGDLLAFNDADDAWRPGKLARQLAHLAAHPDASFTFGAFDNAPDEGLAELPAWARARRDGPLPTFVFQTLLARRDAFSAVGLLDPTLSHAEDIDWFLRARDLGVPFHRADEALVTRYIHAHNLTADTGANARALARVLKRSLDRRRSAP